MEISDYLNESAVVFNVNGRTKKEIFSQLVFHLHKIDSFNNPEIIIDSLIEREALKSTAIGQGIAFPHCRTNSVNKIYFAIGISNTGINFNALDKKPINLLILIIMPQSAPSVSLKLIGKMVQRLKNPKLVKQVMDSKVSNEVVHYFCNQE
jgi:mannitol/fructose-specific phosphotransferase system IIA component (Ntr-type)